MKSRLRKDLGRVIRGGTLMRVFAGGGDVGEKDEKCPDYTTDGSCGGVLLLRGRIMGGITFKLFQLLKKTKTFGMKGSLF